MTYYQEKAKRCVERIYKEEYYFHLWDRVKHKKPLEQCSESELLMPFQLFWDFLPDKPEIRTGPFFEVCDLAEAWCCLGEE